MADETRPNARTLSAESHAAGRSSALTITSLHESQERLALAMEAGGMFAWERDLKTGQVVLSEHAEQMLGLEHGSFGGTHEDFLALVHPADHKALQQEIERASQQDTPFELEFRMVRPDGRVRWGLVRGRVYRDAQGRAVRLAGVDVDITARKLAEADSLFLTQLSERIRRDGDAETLAHDVACAVGEYLQAQRCFFTEVDLAHDHITIHQDYCDGVATIAGAHTLSTFNLLVMALSNSGHTVVVRDTATDQRTTDDTAYRQFGLGAFIVVPLLRHQQMAASVVVTAATPRNWQPREIALLETIGELTWQLLERLRYAATVREREQFNLAVLDSLTNHIAIIDQQGTIIAVNEAWKNFARENGAPGWAEKLGDNYLAVCRSASEDGDASAAETLAGIEAVLRGEINYFTSEYPCHSPETERWFLMTVTALQGRQAGAVILHTDITRRKLAEDSLVSNEARFAGIINSAMDAIISVDSQQQIVLFNHAAEQMFGYTAAEMMGQSLDRLLPARTRAKHADHIRRFGETKTTTRTMGALGAISGVRQGGEEFPIEASISQVEAQGQKLYTVILRDITRRKEAEERVREQAALLNLAREAIIVIDAEGKTLFWNTGAERLYGWSAEEAIGRDMGEQIYGADQTQREDARRVLLEKGEWAGELHQFTKDGREIIVESHWTQLRDENGYHKAKLIISTDITEKKHLEAQFLRAQRLESIGTLASGIAHDLNNVLSPLLMAVQLLQTRLSDESSQRLLDILQQNVQRGSDMIKQVLAFARGTSGERIGLQPRHLIKDVIAILQETFPKNISIKYSLPSDLSAVNGDPTQLHQVLMNLCVNARDAMAEHGGTLTISADNKVVDAQMAGMMFEAQEGNYLVITITDTGTGIAPNVLEKIFDPFFTTKEIGRGTGLGLSTVHSIIKSHDGFVSVYSEVGRGTSFHLYLPMLEVVQPAPVIVPAETLPRGQGEWVLVVDDEEAIRAVTQSTLETYGYHVLTAADGTEAIALYAQHKGQIQIVVTDMMMPYLDGPATIRALRNINPAVEIVASSGLSEGEKAQEAEALGVQAFLTKPYSAADLLQTLAIALNRHTNNFPTT